MSDAPGDVAPPTRALLLGAGLGTRMLPYTRHTPKALFPFLNVPLLEHGLALLARHGVHTVVVNAHHLAAQVVEHVARRAEQHDDGLHVEVVIEERLLGTGGGVRGMARRLDELHPAAAREPVLLLACDVLAPFDLFALAARHAEARREFGTEATMGLVTAADIHRYGAVDVGDDMQLTDIVGRHGRPGAWRAVNGSVHLLERDFVDALPEGPGCLVRDGYLPRLAAGAPCAAWTHAGPWREVGTPALMLEAQRAALSGTLPVDPDVRKRGGRHVTGNMVHPGARVHEDARLLDGTVVGPGVEVGAGAELRGCLVLPGARVEAGRRHDHCILDAADGHVAGRAPLAGQAVGS